MVDPAFSPTGVFCALGGIFGLNQGVLLALDRVFRHVGLSRFFDDEHDGSPEQAEEESPTDQREAENNVAHEVEVLGVVNDRLVVGRHRRSRNAHEGHHQGEEDRLGMQIMTSRVFYPSGQLIFFVLDLKI